MAAVRLLLLVAALAGDASCLAPLKRSPSSSTLASARLIRREGLGSLVARGAMQDSKQAQGARPSAKGIKDRPAVDVMDKISSAAAATAAAVGQDVSVAAAQAAKLAKDVAGGVEGTVKEYPVQSAGIAVAALLLSMLLRGCKEEVAIAKEFSLTTALKKCHDDAAKAASRTSSAAVNLCESAGKRLDLLSASIWNVYKNFTNFAKPLAEEAGDSMVKGTLAAAAKTAETAGRFANWLPNVASPAALKYTVKSGSMKGGSFTIDLGRNTIVGAFVATNKRCREGKNHANGGTRNFEVYVSTDGKVWDLAHKGWLLPGAPKIESQYVTFSGKWGRYVKFVSKSGYKAGSGLLGLDVYPPTGLNSFLWCMNPADVVHSCFDAHMPDAWSTIPVPDPTTIQSTLLRAPIAITRMFGFNTPDDLGVDTAKEAASNWTKALHSTLCTASDAVKSASASMGPVFSNATAAVADAGRAVSCAVADASETATIKATATALDQCKDLAKRFSARDAPEIDECRGPVLAPVLAVILGAIGFLYRDPIGGAAGPIATNVGSKIGPSLGSVGRAVTKGAAAVTGAVAFGALTVTGAVSSGASTVTGAVASGASVVTAAVGPAAGTVSGAVMGAAGVVEGAVKHAVYGVSGAVRDAAGKVGGSPSGKMPEVVPAHKKAAPGKPAAKKPVAKPAHKPLVKPAFKNASPASGERRFGKA